MTVDELLAEVSRPNPRPGAVKAVAEELRHTRARLEDVLRWPEIGKGPLLDHIRETLASPNSLDCTTLEPRRPDAPARPGIGDVVVKK